MTYTEIIKALEVEALPSEFNCVHGKYIEACGIYCGKHRTNAEYCHDCKDHTMDCTGARAKATLDLIKRQQAEIEAHKHYYNECLKDLKNAHAEIERLKKENTVLREDNHILATEYAVKAKSEAIKEYEEKLHPYKLHYGNLRMEIAREFADRLKEKAYTNNYCQEVVLKDDIDNLLKEMEEETE